ncbi:MAG TPA: hypothetical protein VF590_09915, partial [Isosphaeraceae bacterium]
MRPVAGPTRHWLRLILLGLLLHGIAPLASAQERPDRRPGAGGLAGPARGSVPRIAQRGPGGPRAPSGSWLGQDGHDLVGSATALAGNDVQDIHVLLRGLPPGREVHFISVRGLGGGEWQYRTDGPFNPWRAALARTAQAPTADLYLDPYRPEAGRPFAVTIRYDDGSTAEFDLRGGKADPDLRMPRAALQVRWIGQDRQDWVGTGPSVGPDGLQDAHLALAQLSGNVEIRAVAVEGPGGIGWQYGLNPKGLSNAELIRPAGDPSRADLYIAADRVPGGKTLTVTVAYANDKTDRATVVAGRVDPALRMPEPAPLRMASAKVTAQWKGQDGAPETTPGDVHISLSGLPAGRGVAAAALSDSIRGFWSYRASDRVPEFIEPYPRPLAFRRGTSPTRAELFFPPYRDEAGATLTLRLVFDDGTTAVTQVSGGPCDLGLRAPRPERTTGTARPGDDLHALVGRFGTVRLARGEYRLTRPLVLNRPVTLTAEPGTTLRFAQEPGDAPWTTAIKVHHGHTTLEGFAVRFAGPIRWDQQVSFGPAVIGTTDDRDGEPARVLADLAFLKLDL